MKSPPVFHTSGSFPWSVSLFRIISQVPFVIIAFNPMACASYKDKVSLTRKVPQCLKYLSWSQVYRLELGHETSQVAVTHGGAVCDGSLETLAYVVSLLEDSHIMKRHHKYNIMYGNV